MVLFSIFVLIMRTNTDYSAVNHNDRTFILISHEIIWELHQETKFCFYNSRIKVLQFTEISLEIKAEIESAREASRDFARILSVLLILKLIISCLKQSNKPLTKADPGPARRAPPPPPPPPFKITRAFFFNYSFSKTHLILFSL